MNYRKIVENHIGRRLNKDELVHHIDGNQLNNDISNLQIVDNKTHGMIHTKQKIDYVSRVQKMLKDYSMIDLSTCLDILFSPRQKHIIYKKFLKEPLSKTEREYFSRTCRHKLKAIAHPTLFSIAQQMAWQLL